MKALLSSPSDDPRAPAFPLTASRWRPVLRVRVRRTSNDLLSVLATPGQTPHPMFALRRIQAGPGEGAPSNVRPSSCGPAKTASAFHQLRIQLVRAPFFDVVAMAYAFSAAPSGITPCSRNRHSSINSFRASATMPTFLARVPPRPKRS